MSITVVVP
ncbi:hypothetical protein E2C01_082126 [Portunus trituberculatus]|uniref:Uncharacterized protein n=1 Tax=Portunus trituberculatus TaxID=210409 RepID=A0A5B7IY94_PORTR|nr:hypothetical protein [Portunus trituberculatus]